MHKGRRLDHRISGPLVVVLALSTFARAADRPQWGEAWSRNQTSPETNLPDTFDPTTGLNIKWVADLGSQSYSTPTIAGGRVLIGTNNDQPRDPKHEGDRAVLMCLNETDGALLWQLVIPKLSEDYNDRFLDWPKIGFSSDPTIEGDRAYALTNRGEVVCLDMKGMSDGNDGPYKDEAAHHARRGEPPVEPGPTDGDILWLTDLVEESGIRTHDQVHGSILVRGDFLYVNSCNGVDNTHRLIRTPDAPSLVVLDKRTGKIVATDGLHLGPVTFHVGWSSPSLGRVNGQDLLFFGGANGVCYAFEPLDAELEPAGGQPATLKERWRFDADPAAPKENVHQWVGNRRESPSVIMGMPVFVPADGTATGVAAKPRLYFTAGGDLWWGKRESSLRCVDASQAGDVTKSAELWSYPLARESSCTPAVWNGLVFAVDCSGTIHCVDATTGKGYWTHKAVGDFWSSPLVADGKVYVGTRRGQFKILAASKELKELASVDLKDPISGSATAANGVLYVATGKKLFALKEARATVSLP